MKAEEEMVGRMRVGRRLNKRKKRARMVWRMTMCEFFLTGLKLITFYFMNNRTVLADKELR